MSIRKFVLFVAAVLFITAGVLAFTHRSAEEQEYNQPEPTENVPDVQTVLLTAVGDCTLATDVNAEGSTSFDSYAERAEGDYSYFLKNVAPIFSEDDLTIVNFEGTLSDRGERQDKTFAFRGKPEYVNVLTTSSVEAANLANNHSADYGEVSLTDTIRYLNEAGISNFIGTNTAMVEINGIKVGLVGIDALNDDETLKMEKAIGSVKSMGAQLVILSIHWGIEKDYDPTDEQIELGHKAVDLGANLVIGTHPHVLQGIEKYNGAYILYSLGNFCFGGNNNPSDKDTMIYRQQFMFVDGKLLDNDDIKIIPATISGHDDYNDYQPAIAEGERKASIENRIIDYSSRFGTQTLLKFE